MDNIFEEACLILLVLDKTSYVKYSRYLDKLPLEMESKRLLQTIGAYFDTYPDTETVLIEDLLLFFNKKHPVLRTRPAYQDYLTRLTTLTLNRELLISNFNSYLDRYYAAEIITRLTPALNTSDSEALLDAQDMILEAEQVKLKLTDGSVNPHFVNTSLQEILNKEILSEGIPWRLSCLNNDIGSLRKGTLGHVFARVDTGKTSFLVSEITHMASYLQKDEIILWCNNEEKGERVKLRLYQALLDCDKPTLVQNACKAEQAFKERGGDKIVIYDNFSTTIEDMRDLLTQHNVRILVIDQGDKVTFNGHNQYSTVEKLKVIYGKLRELAKEFDVDIITVGQASAAAEGRKWLQLDHMDNSKTGKPGELDYAIGIGKTQEDLEDMRFISVCKNKLNNGAHGKHDVILNTTRAIYSDFKLPDHNSHAYSMSVVTKAM